MTTVGTPLFCYYGSMVDPQGSGVILAIAGALWCTVRWQKCGRRRFLMGAQLFLVYGYGTDWLVFLAGGLLGLWLLWVRGRRGLAAATVFWGTAFLCGAFLLFWTFLVTARVPAASTVLGGFLNRSALGKGWVDDTGKPFILADLLGTCERNRDFYNTKILDRDIEKARELEDMEIKKAIEEEKKAHEETGG